jgi:NADH dehydrogenase/NADH:ubiquinone oxidoreductase subunit G
MRSWHSDEASMTINLTINDRSIQVAEGRTLLEACREHGIHVPTLCYHPALQPYGACRLCMVEVSQPPRPPRRVAACTYPCEDGAVVRTDTEAVQRSRRATAELLLAGASHTPEIMALAEELGVTEVRFRMPEENPCVLCGLCVRACREIVGVSAISFIRRGIAKKVSPPFEIASSTCIGCGTCVLVCPTGALTLSDVTGFRSVHPSESAYAQGYCRVCGDADLCPHFVEDAASLLAVAKDEG